MNNQSNYFNHEHKSTKGDGTDRERYSGQKEQYKSKSDEDLIIEENTIYEIDRSCMERLKRNRRR